MTNSLVGSSRVRLIGEVVTDIAIVQGAVETGTEIKAVSTVAATRLDSVPDDIGGVTTFAVDDLVILKNQGSTGTNGIRNGLYRVASRRGTDQGGGGSGGNNTRMVLLRESIDGRETFAKGTEKYRFNPATNNFEAFTPGAASSIARSGANNFLDDQVGFLDAKFAKIYAATYEGQYIELHRPTIFLVHGEGLSFTDGSAAAAITDGAFAPKQPNLSGVASTDVFLSSNLKYWEYDRADFTVRMDLYGGMFEEVLLGFEFGGGDDPDGDGSVGGGRVGGGRVGGGRVGGGRVGGGRVGGGRVGGGRVGGGRVGGGRVGGG